MVAADVVVVIYCCNFQPGGISSGRGYEFSSALCGSCWEGENVAGFSRRFCIRATNPLCFLFFAVILVPSPRHTTTTFI